MKAAQSIGSIIAILALLALCSGAAAATEIIDFSDGKATISVGDVSVVNGDTLNIKIDLTNLNTVADGSTLKVKLDGFHDMLDGLTLSSFNMKMSSSGINTAQSNVVVGTFLIDVNMGSMDSMKSMTITKDTTKYGFNLLDLLNSNLYSVTLELVPDSTSASVHLEITGKLDSTTKSVVNPKITVKDVDVKKLTGNPNIAFNIATSGSNIDKTYVLKVFDIIEPTPTATATPTPTATYTDSPQVTPTSGESLPIPTMVPIATQPTQTHASPAPILGILAGCVGAVGILFMKRQKKQ